MRMASNIDIVNTHIFGDVVDVSHWPTLGYVHKSQCVPPAEPSQKERQGDQQEEQAAEKGSQLAHAAPGQEPAVQ